MEFNQNKELLSNTLALNVALQTIKERCVHLQKRLYALESENSRLRLNSVSSGDKLSESRKDNSLISELESLRAKNAELTLQKSQLTENLSMISTENRKLWKRLSHLTKENITEADLTKDEAIDDDHLGAKHANLIRSKTFTQNSPHQLLRERIAGKNIGPDHDDNDLEDISLINDCTFTASTDKFSSDISDSVEIETRSCAEGLLNIKKEILKQNSDLKVALSNWRKLKNSDFCSCKTSSKTSETSKKPQMSDKMVMTERDLTLEFLVDQDPANNFETVKQETTVLADLIEKKKVADLAEKGSRIFDLIYLPNVWKVLRPKYFIRGVSSAR
ncbi:hypothetical protein ACKWTF_013126 [Chironomus riparius]